MRAATAVMLAAMAGMASADVYMHSPAGSNDRNRERNENRQNANRLFDSQNNGKGGYPWRGDPTLNGVDDAMTYYSGSILRLEWTAQHSCGPNPKVHCELILQYACDDTLVGVRDGYPTGTLTEGDANNPNQWQIRQFTTNTGNGATQGTSTIPNPNNTPGLPATVQNDADKTNRFYYNGEFGGVEYGMHEGPDYFMHCRRRQRNKGLYTADQDLRGRNEAIYTRQNPNGERYGLECAEERDYYPYWHPTPWKDIAVLVSNMAFCPYYEQHSQNVEDRWFCNNCGSSCRGQTADGTIPITNAECTAAGGAWTMVNSFGLPPPECKLHGLSRDNHLGNVNQVDASGSGVQPDAGEPSTAYYNWMVPADAEGKKCVIRMRYNMSDEDYPSHSFISGINFFDASRNCPPGTRDPTKPGCDAVLTADQYPLYNRPYVEVLPGLPKLGFAANTNQKGRTFQDRSYVFKVDARPGDVPSTATIWNLNTRGRRGNIVQAYPAVEYDFVPTHLEVVQGDYIHWQWSGSDYNQAQNPNNGEGWQFSDRFNAIQTESQTNNFPLFHEQSTLFGDEAFRKRIALQDQETKTNFPCAEYVNGQTGEQNSRNNCGKLNNAPNRWPPNPADGLMAVDQAVGTYSYMSTRNNNFSNRGMKAAIVVSYQLSVAAIIGISFAAASVVGLGGAGLWWYAKNNPTSKLGQFLSSRSSAGTSLRA